jgi:hypothetical protein
MNKKEIIQCTNMVEQKCIKTSCKHFSHCGCLICNVFESHPEKCKKFIPCKPVPKW